MIVVGCSNSVRLARQIARRMHCDFFALDKKNFPDGELHLRFMKPVCGQDVVLVQSFQPQPQEALVEILWCAEHARASGARSITLVAPYLGYIRQDKAFVDEELVSAQILGRLLSRSVDRVVTVDPHFHRIKNASEIFSCDVMVLSAHTLVGNFVKKKYGKGIIVGPDSESEQWAATVAREIGWGYTVLTKKRLSPSEVVVSPPKNVNLRGKIVVIVDDIISTGGTVAQAAHVLRKQKPKKIVTVCVHGVFADGAAQRLKKGGVKEAVATNTIQNEYACIDVSGLIVGAL